MGGKLATALPAVWRWFAILPENLVARVLYGILAVGAGVVLVRGLTRMSDRRL